MKLAAHLITVSNEVNETFNNQIYDRIVEGCQNSAKYGGRCFAIHEHNLTRGDNFRVSLDKAHNKAKSEGIVIETRKGEGGVIHYYSW